MLHDELMMHPELLGGHTALKLVDGGLNVRISDHVRGKIRLRIVCTVLEQASLGLSSQYRQGGSGG